MANIKYCDMPLTSTLDSKSMKRATALLKEVAEIDEQLEIYQSRRDEIIGTKDQPGELEKLQQKFNLPGMRWGDFVYVRSESKGRETLDKNKLMENGVSAEQIAASMKVGNPVVTRKFVNLLKQKEDKSDE